MSTRRFRSGLLLPILAGLLSACGTGDELCAPDNGGLSLPEGFCAIVVADAVAGARHLEVAANGDVFVARRNLRESRDAPLVAGGVAVLRDTDGDGVADRRELWGENGGNGIVLDGGFVYFAPDDAVLRYPIEEGSMTPSGAPDTIVSGLPADRNHAAKTIVIGPDRSLYVNIGSPSNACMQQARTAGSPGMDPCPERETRAGIWRFDADAVGQTQEDGVRFAAGLRNTVALRMHPTTHVLYGAVHGRDQLHDMFPDRFTVDQSTEKPSEEFVRLDEGSDFGWPYCYHDPETGEKYLAPEFGGDGHEVGRCGEMDMPIIGFPAHWAPNDLVFYQGSRFPARYQGGAFIAFHGSWNRAPNPQDGYRVVFVPAEGDHPGSTWEVFADGFRSAAGGSEDTMTRPVGLALGPDGSLYISDSVRGRVWRVVYRGS
ncbi:MAG: PQQ-dependent sugar dehydrogenase [Gemmatimonadota bacterium]|nr:PQQ-dependent sugar dehydrogenase [Gemmatimonadota bacterium]